MKWLFVVLLVLLVFFGCATFGYQFAGKMDQASQPTAVVDAASTIPAEQHRFVIIRADALDAAQPRLISIWYVSIFFLEDNPTTLTLAQVYPVKTPAASSQALALNFSLDPQTGEPGQAFWNALETYGFQWEAFIVTDAEGANAFLSWLSGPADYRPSLLASDGNADNSVQIATNTCVAVANAAAREIGSFDWGAIVPVHFRSSLRIEHGLAYWDRVTGGAAVRCEIVPAP